MNQYGLSRLKALGSFYFFQTLAGTKDPFCSAMTMDSKKILGDWLKRPRRILDFFEVGLNVCVRVRQLKSSKAYRRTVFARFDFRAMYHSGFIAATL